MDINSEQSKLIENMDKIDSRLEWLNFMNYMMPTLLKDQILLLQLISMRAEKETKEGINIYGCFAGIFEDLVLKIEISE